MDSLELNNFNSRWNERYMLMKDQHRDEIASFSSHAETRRKEARDSAKDQLHHLRNTSIKPAELYDQVRKIEEQCDATLRSIDEHFARRMRDVKQIQLEDEESHNRAYARAQANRNSVLSDHNVSVDTPEPLAGIATTTESKDVPPTQHSESVGTLIAEPPEHQSPGFALSQMLPAESAAPTTVALQEPRSASPLPENGFSATVQRESAADGSEQYILRYKTKNRKALQDAVQSEFKRPAFETNQTKPMQVPIHPVQPVRPPPIPDPTDLKNTAEIPGLTITYNEVYRDGKAQHKDTIIEYPKNSRQWYILKCEEHQVHFKQWPLHGAAKHLDSRSHGNLGRSRDVAIRTLGYRVIDCNEQLAAQNNKVVDEAFANGYKPTSIINPENKIKKTRKKRTHHPKPAAHMPQQVLDHPNENMGASQILHRIRAAKPVITNPKPLHVYLCFWPRDKSYYPVMILGWDDQTAGGHEGNLAGTGLLDKGSNPPCCYVYRDVGSKTHSAIVGWSYQYQDGGAKIKQRRFPVKFDDESNVGWVAARALSKYPLFESDSAAKKEFHMDAQRWVAKKEGFNSWEAFETAHKKTAQASKSTAIPTPVVSPLTDANEHNGDANTENDVQSSQSSDSNITQMELEEIRDTAGEIEGDDDYFESDMDSTLDDECVWDEPGADGRPWAFYDLRKESHVTINTNTEVLAHEHPQTACTQEIASSIKDGSTIQPEIQNIYIKGTLEKDNTSKVLGNLPTPETDTASTRNRTASPSKEAHLLTQRPPHKDISLVTESDLGPLTRSSTSHGSRPSGLVVLETETMLKRARSEEKAEPDIGAPSPGGPKRIRLETEPPRTQAEWPMVSQSQPPPQPIPEPSPPALQPFIPCTTSGPCQFELSSYCKGEVSWKSADGSCLKLWFQEDRKRIGTVDGGTLDMVIDPTTVRAFVKEEIPGSKGNSLLTLLPRDVDDKPVQLVFDRGVGSKTEIGKVQARRFWMWMREVVSPRPLPLLTSVEQDK